MTYLKAQRIRSLVQDAMAKIFAEVDLLVTPTYFNVATKVSDPVDPPQSLPRPKSRGLSDLVAFGNLAGLPALSLPCGLADGLPVGLSLVSRPFTENQLVAAGMQFQASTNWHLQRPTL